MGSFSTNRQSQYLLYTLARLLKHNRTLTDKIKFVKSDGVYLWLSPHFEPIVSWMLVREGPELAGHVGEISQIRDFSGWINIYLSKLKYSVHPSCISKFVPAGS